jgi:regulatory protein
MKPPKQLSPEELFSYAVKKLSGRAATEGEIRTSLLARALHPEDVPGIVERLREYGYLDDARFAESFATARLENEGFGKARVARDLQQRCVAPELAEQTISKIYAEQDEVALIEQFIRRKYKRPEGEILFETNNDLASAYRRLVRAGFTPSNALRVLKRFAANPDLLEEP